MDLALLQALGTALFIGALVGIERTQQHAEGTEFAGFRTFILLAELGAVLGWISTRTQSMAAFVGGLLAVVVIVGVAYVVERQRNADPIGLTTQVAALVVYTLGGITVMGHPILAVAIAIVTAALLATKQAMHTAVRRISHTELLAALRLLFASFIVLPILPRAPIDPWQAINPYKLWLLVVLISALSMVGYVAVRVLGAARGLLVTAFFGGLVSSTATTLTFAKQSREEERLSRYLAAGTLLAWTVMFVRILVLVAILRFSLVSQLWLPCLVLGAVSALFGLVIMWRTGHDERERALPREASFRNPFSLLSAMKFALIFGAVLLITKVIERHAPSGGMYLLGAIAGATDADAVVLSVAGVPVSPILSETVLARTIMLAAVANTAAKFGLALGLGSRRLSRTLLLPSLGVAVLGLLALLLIR